MRLRAQTVAARNCVANATTIHPGRPPVNSTSVGSAADLKRRKASAAVIMWKLPAGASGSMPKQTWISLGIGPSSQYVPCAHPDPRSLPPTPRLLGGVIGRHIRRWCGFWLKGDPKNLTEDGLRASVAGLLYRRAPGTAAAKLYPPMLQAGWIL